MSTLAGELLSAASGIDCRCRDFGKPCRRELEAARLRQRAAWVQGLEDRAADVESKSLNCCDATELRTIRRLVCSDIPVTP